MKQKLLFLLTALMLLTTGNAWGETITFDFKTAAASGGITAGSLTNSSSVAGYIAGSSTAVYLPNEISSELNGFFAFQYRSTNEWSVDKGRGGLWSYAKSGNDENFSICNLQAGDIVTITLQSGEIFFSSTLPNATWDNSGTETTVAQWEALVSNRSYKIKGDGKLDLQAKKYQSGTRDHMVISKVVIERSYTRLWGMDFITLANNLGAGSGKSVTKSETPSFDSYYNITDAGFNTNFGVNNANWQVRANSGSVGLWPYNISGTMAIQNLPKNAFVTFWASDNVDAGTNAIKIASLSGSNYYTFQIIDEGIATFTPKKSSYIYSVGVYKVSGKEIIGALDYSTAYLGDKKSFSISKGETKTLTFINHGQNTQNYFNWVLQIVGNNEGAGDDLKWRADNYVVDDGESTYTTRAMPGFDWNWETFRNNLQNSEVTMTISYGTDGILSLVAKDGPGKCYTHTLSYKAGNTFSGDVTLNLSVDHSWIEFLSEETTAVSATIGATGWATFSSDYALDFSKATEGLEAYMITGHDGNVVTKSQVTGTVPAGTGLLLKGAAGSYNIPVVASSETNVSANLMKAGTGEPVSAEAGKTKYVLGVNNNGTVGDTSDDFAEFQKIVSTAATVPVGKAYLQFNEMISGARALIFDPDEVTSINVVEVTEPEAGALKDGKFLENGKIVIVKNGVKYSANGQILK